MRTCLVLLAVLSFGLSDTLDAADVMPVVMAAVHDYAGVPPDVLTEAEADVSAIFRHAGVRLAWVDALASRATVRVHILSGPMAVLTRTGPEVLGLATVHSGMVWVIYDRVVDKSIAVNVRTSRVLGFVIAHEIGHLLLAGRGHGHVGLMQPRLERDVLRTGLLRFTREEGREMRASDSLSK